VIAFFDKLQNVIYIVANKKLHSFVSANGISTEKNRLNKSRLVVLFYSGSSGALGYHLFISCWQNSVVWALQKYFGRFSGLLFNTSDSLSQLHLRAWK